MSRERFTIVITSNRNLATKVLSLPKSWILFATSLGILLVGLMTFVVFDYVQLLVKETKYKFLLDKNTALENQVREYSEKVGRIQVDLEKIDRFSKKLRMITNVENESDREMELTLGKPLIDSSDNRDPASSSYSKIAGAIEEKHEHNEASGDGEFGAFPLLKKSVSEYAFMNSQTRADLLLNFDKTTKKAHEIEKEMTLLWEKIAAQKDLLSATPSIRPTNGWQSSGFGYRTDPFTKRTTMHKGLDFAAGRGTPIYAPADGIVSYVGREGGYGKIVSIDHGYGIVTRYAHNSKIHVKRGQKISRWDKIAEVGSTGRSSGPHLHYEVRLNGVPVDPENYILSE